MDSKRVELQNKLRETLQRELCPVIGNKYFSDTDYRPISEGDLFKIQNISYLIWDATAEEVRYVNDQLIRGRLIIRNPAFINSASGENWVDRISSLGGVLEVPDIGVTYEDVFKWERYKIGGRYTGRLKISDERVVDDDIGPISGIVKGIEVLLEELIDGLSIQSEETPIPLEFVEKATPKEWEYIDKIRPSRI